MSFTGSLEDVSVVDVLQFVHLGERSGTLYLSSRDGRAEVGFHRGRIISAHGPRSKRLGEVLVEQGAVSREGLEAALAEQRRRASELGVPLGQLLVERGDISPDELRRAVERHVEHTIYGLIAWNRGTFEFAVDELKPIDDLAVCPGDILPDIHINTQLVLLEATRLFDERARSRPPQAPGEEPEDPLGGAGAEPAISDAPTSKREPAALSNPPSSRAASEPQTSAEPLPRVQVLSDDSALATAIARALPRGFAHVLRVRERDAGVALPHEPSVTLIADMRSASRSAEWLASLSRSRRRAVVFAVVDELELGAGAHLYLHGAQAVLPPEAAIVSAAVTTFLRIRQRICSERMVREGLRHGFDRLQRLIGEFRSGLVTATVSLNLMNIISESVERAVLLLMRRDDLLVLGAFGYTENGESLAERARGLVFPLCDLGTLGESAADGRSRLVRFEECKLPSALRGLIGRPTSGDCAVFPIVGGKKVIALIYADNGKRQRPLDQVEFLEVAAAQVGMAYENELLRRQLGALG
jgi:hypothetical protein